MRIFKEVCGANFGIDIFKIGIPWPGDSRSTYKSPGDDDIDR